MYSTKREPILALFSSTFDIGDLLFRPFFLCRFPQDLQKQRGGFRQHLVLFPDDMVRISRGGENGLKGLLSPVVLMSLSIPRA